jgi:2-iminobutanoate/2-iminopropanoate deaminase
MHKVIGLPAFMLLLATSSAAWAQASPTLEKKNYNYSEWTKGRFSEAVTVTGPGKMIFLAGVGAEDEGSTPGIIRHKDDFMGQCRYAYDKIKRLLDRHGATLGDVVKMVTYVRYPLPARLREMPGGSVRQLALAGAHVP